MGEVRRVLLEDEKVKFVAEVVTVCFVLFLGGHLVPSWDKLKVIGEVPVWLIVDFPDFTQNLTDLGEVVDKSHLCGSDVLDLGLVTFRQLCGLSLFLQALVRILNRQVSQVALLHL